MIDPHNVPLSALADSEIIEMLADAQNDPKAELDWLADLEHEYAERLG